MLVGMHCPAGDRRNVEREWPQAALARNNNYAMQRYLYVYMRNYGTFSRDDSSFMSLGMMCPLSSCSWAQNSPPTLDNNTHTHTHAHTHTPPPPPLPLYSLSIKDVGRDLGSRYYSTFAD